MVADIFSIFSKLIFFFFFFCIWSHCYLKAGIVTFFETSAGFRTLHLREFIFMPDVSG